MRSFYIWAQSIEDLGNLVADFTVKVPQKPICSIPGCQKSIRRNGLCDMHATRKRRYGDPLYVKLRRKDDPEYQQHKRKCEVKECDRPHSCKGYCKLHYWRWSTHGDLHYHRLPPKRIVRPCTVKGCTRKCVAKGYCRSHYHKWNRNADPLFISTRVALSPQQVLEAIAALSEKTVHNVRSSKVRSTNSNLYNSAIKHYGNWRSAVRATGLDYSQIKKKIHLGQQKSVGPSLKVISPKWSRKTVAQEILALSRAGAALSSRGIRKSRPALYAAACKYCGGWAKAIDLAGLDYRKINKYAARQVWSREQVIKAITERNKGSVSLGSFSVRSDNPSLYKAARTHFQEWRRAVEAAEINYDDVKQKVLLKAVKSRTKWTKNQVLNKIQGLHQSGSSLSMQEIQKENMDLYGAACHHFRGWKEAVEQAGIDYDFILQTVYRKRAKKITIWSKEKVLATVREFHQKGEPLYTGKIERDHRGLYEAAMRYVGSWPEAITKAGLNYDEISQKSVRHKFGSSAERLAYEVKFLCGEAFEHHKVFRSKALIAAGMTRLQPDFENSDGSLTEVKLDSFSKGVIRSIEKYDKYITKGIKRMEILYFTGAERNLPGYPNVKFVHILKKYGPRLRKSHEGQHLLMRIREFIQGKLALRKFWSRGRIITEIRKLWEKHGDLSYLTVKEYHPRLYNAAASPRNFGSWAKAVETAGYRYEDFKKVGHWSRDKVLKYLQIYQAVGFDKARFHQETSIPFYKVEGAAIRHCKSMAMAFKTIGIERHNSLF